MTERKAVKHTVSEVPGAVRKSPRVYTHAVVGDFDLEAVRAAIIKAEGSLAAINFAYYAECLKLNKLRSESDPYRPTREECERIVALGVDGYTKEATERALSRVEAKDGETHVIQWSMSEANAIKAARSGREGYRVSYRNVRVVPVTRHG